MTRLIVRLAAVAMPLWAGAAGAAQQWPVSIIGTWSTVSNQTQLNVVISSQSGNGACQQIAGTIGADSVRGYYCPGSGRFNFVRSNASGQVSQAYTGNMTETAMGPASMTGIMADYVDQPVGEYGFAGNQ